MPILAQPSRLLGKFLALVAITPSLLVLPLNAETRCGWLANPTPGNWWLTDRDATWTISTQGSANRAQNMELIPDISAKQYVKVNGNYGYGCACMDVATNSKRKRITAIKSFEQLNLEVCRNDKALSKP
ncbi:MAG: DUF4087 domain-containing protein [Pseudanabaenaceae cyanobacterium bins.68]|nr:DUF4087 domain-containing protein [Pseudanabaenaceae cyanobacterium bins.68]